MSPLPPPDLVAAIPQIVDANPASKAITDAVTTLLSLDLFDRAGVGRYLHLRWTKTMDQFSRYTIYQGVPDSTAALFESAEYMPEEQFDGKDFIPVRVNLKLVLSEQLCYSGSVLKINLSKDHMGHPVLSSHGYQPPGIALRSGFEVDNKWVVLAYREPIEKFCVRWIEIRSPR